LRPQGVKPLITNHETHIPAKQDQAQATTRLPGADAHAGGQGRAQFSQKQGPQETDRLINAARRVHFSRHSRITHPADYRKAFRSPQRFEESGFLFISRRNGLRYPRLGLAIPRKHVKRAVTRNLLKRLIRENFRDRQGQLGGQDIIVTVTRNLEHTDPRSIKQVISNQFQKCTACAKQQSS